jgi:hypothetical protein
MEELHGLSCRIGSNPPPPHPPQAITQYAYHSFSCLSTLCVARKACQTWGDGAYFKRQQKCVGLLQYKIPHTFCFVFSNMWAQALVFH